MQRGFKLFFFVTTILSVAPSVHGVCLTTFPPNPPFMPPAPYSTNAGQGFWYGTDALWVKLPVSRDGTRKGVAVKLFVWSRGYNWRTDPEPHLIVTGKRLDGDAQPIAISGGTNAASGVELRDLRMLIGVVFPTEGCWEVTAYHGEHALTFVVSVEP